jgi:hypothetical protein
MTEIRAVAPGELESLSRPLRRYAFGEAPGILRPRSSPESDSESTTFVAFEGGTPVATLSVEWLRQNIRGVLVPAAGISRVASHPDFRRGGRVRMLLERAHAEARERGAVTAALYPFRPTFYARFDYATLPLGRLITISGRGALPAADPDVTCRLAEPGPALDAARDEAELRWLEATHGAVVRADAGVRRDELARDPRHVCIAEREGAVVGALVFRSEALGGPMLVDRLLVADDGALRSLLAWFAAHGDQFSEFRAEMSPDATPELWLDDLEYADATSVRLPLAAAPMARVLDIAGVDGAEAGTGSAQLRVERAQGADGVTLVADDGRLRVIPGASDEAPTISPADLTRALLGVPLRHPVPELERLLPRRTPWLGRHF